MELTFWKYEGAGNDFILIDGRVTTDATPEHSTAPSQATGIIDIELPGETIRALCDRHTGIGADGLMILTLDPVYDFRMRYYNSDGGEVNMCGNGGRCITLFAHHLGIGGPEKTFVGRDGVHTARMLSDEGDRAQIEIGMIDVNTYEYSDKAFYLNTGVPHYVEFVDNVDQTDVLGRGREIRYSERFKAQGGTNVNFVEILRPCHIKVRTYERGVENETQACGTGATAAAIATHLYAQSDCDDFTVTVAGGIVDVSFRTDNHRDFTSIKLTGPARKVFEGVIRTGNLYYHSTHLSE